MKSYPQKIRLPESKRLLHKAGIHEGVNLRRPRIDSCCNSITADDGKVLPERNNWINCRILRARVWRVKTSWCGTRSMPVEFSREMTAINASAHTMYNRLMRLCRLSQCSNRSWMLATVTFVCTLASRQYVTVVLVHRYRATKLSLRKQNYSAI